MKNSIYKTTYFCAIFDNAVINVQSSKYIALFLGQMHMNKLSAKPAPFQTFECGYPLKFNVKYLVYIIKSNSGDTSDGGDSDDAGDKRQ